MTDSARLRRDRDLQLAVEKLGDFATALLDGYIGARRRYAVLEPMIVRQEIAERWGKGSRGFAFETVREAMYLNSVHEIAKIAGDRDQRTSSLATVMALLQEAGVRAELRRRFSEWIADASWNIVDRPEGISDESLASLSQEWRRENVARLARNFDQIWERLWVGWGRIQGQEWYPRFLQVRNKVTAHKELRKKESGGYEPVDPAELGLKWDDAGEALDAVEPIVMDAYLLATNTNYAADSMRSQLREFADDFWSATAVQEVGR